MRQFIEIIVLFACLGCVFTASTRRKRNSDYDTQVELGEPCIQNKDCFQEFTACAAVCACAEGYHEYRKECVESAIIGTECEDNARCSNLSNSECAAGSCRCLKDFLNGPDGISCLMVAEELGDDCEVDEQCAGLNATCKEKECVFVPRVLNEVCVHMTDCDAALHLTCVNASCKCDADIGFVLDKTNKCVEVAKNLGDSCTLDAMCERLPNATCVDNKCTAPQVVTEAPVIPLDDSEEVDEVVQNKTTVLSAQSGPVVPVNLVGAACSSNADCSHIPSTHCLDLVCQCIDDFVPSESAKTCLPVAKEVGGVCEITVQCASFNGLCADGKCVLTKESQVGASSDPSTKGTGNSVGTASMLIVTTVFCIFRLT